MIKAEVKHNLYKLTKNTYFMRNKLILSLFLLFVIVIYGCAQPTPPVQQAPDLTEEPEEVIEEESDLSEEETEVVEEEEDKISEEVKELLSLSDKKVKSINYRYRGPQTGTSLYDFSVRDTKLKYLIDPTFKDVGLDDTAYDTIYLDKTSKTALAYCDGRRCRVKGEKQTLDYDQSYIMTPLDWLDSIKSAEKLGEELIKKRSTWKLSTNSGTMWVDTFFGVPLQIESVGNVYKFEMMVFNQVKDEDER